MKNPLERERWLDEIDRTLKTFPFKKVIEDEAFYVFAIKVCSNNSTGQRKLQAGKVYYFLDGFEIKEDDIFVAGYRFDVPIYDYYHDLCIGSPHVSFSAIVGENGSGKSSLVEYEIRLINNLASALFGDNVKDGDLPHLHYIDKLDGELFYVLGKTVYRLKVFNRSVALDAFSCVEIDDSTGDRTFKKTIPSKELVNADEELQRTPVESVYSQKGYEGLESVLSCFFYTIVHNQSLYAYNTNDFRWECNTEEYEQVIHGGKKKDDAGNEIPYSIEDRCWLNGLFHKNDGYQVPLVLSPYRYMGNIDINTENKLAYERLVSQLVISEDKDRIINGHLKVNFFEVALKDRKYDLPEVHANLGFGQFTENDFSRMKKMLLEKWSSRISFDLESAVRSRLHGKLAGDYLVYKTLKIALTYDEYRDIRGALFNKAVFDPDTFALLVDRTIDNYSHVSRKLYRTIAYIIWGIYDKQGLGVINYSLDEINKMCVKALGARDLDYSNKTCASILSELPVVPPFYDLSIGLWELKEGKGDVRFEHLSSGEKQQAYTISSLIYHLRNIDSVKEDESTRERVSYRSVQIILEEVELYYHPELQRTFVRNILDGIKRASLYNIKWINIQIVTHSPFVLSDIPSYNVLALRKNDEEPDKICSLGANIYEMLKLSFFLEGTAGDYSKWLVKRIAQCLRVHRWLEGIESEPPFFPSLQDVPAEYEFLTRFTSLEKNTVFNAECFRIIYSPQVLLSLINLIGEPVIRRALVEDYGRSFPNSRESYIESLRKLLETQLAALK